MGVAEEAMKNQDWEKVKLFIILRFNIKL